MTGADVDGLRSHGYGDGEILEIDRSVCPGRSQRLVEQAPDPIPHRGKRAVGALSAPGDGPPAALSSVPGPRHV